MLSSGNESDTFIELRNLLDKDDDARELLDPIISRLHGVCHLDGEDVLLVEVVIDGLKRGEAVLGGFVRCIIWERGIAVIKTGFGVTHTTRRQDWQGGEGKTQQGNNTGKWGKWGRCVTVC